MIKIKTGAFPTREYALRVDGKFAPLEVNYYSISRDYPITNTAIQPLSADFIWQYRKPVEPILSV